MPEFQPGYKPEQSVEQNLTPEQAVVEEARKIINVEAAGMIVEDLEKRIQRVKEKGIEPTRSDKGEALRLAMEEFAQGETRESKFQEQVKKAISEQRESEIDTHTKQ